MLKIRTASTELTLGAFCCTQHSCKECRQIAFIGVTHNIYAKNLCYLSDKQLLLRLICLHSNVRKAHHFPIWRQCQIQKRHAGRRACPLPEVHARRQERPLARLAMRSEPLHTATMRKEPLCLEKISSRNVCHASAQMPNRTSLRKEWHSPSVDTHFLSVPFSRRIFQSEISRWCPRAGSTANASSCASSCSSSCLSCRPL